MKIMFKVAAGLTTEELIALHKQEDVGWDESGGNAMLIFRTSRGLTQHRLDGSTVHLEEDCGKVIVGNKEYDVSRFKEATWVTCWSGFTYSKVGEKIWQFEGALNGFLSQNLIPPTFKQARQQVLSCEGRYGKFTGPDSLTNYGRLRDNWRGVWYGLLHGILVEDNRSDSLPEVGPHQVLCKEHTMNEVADLVWDRICNQHTYDAPNEAPNPAIESLGLNDDRFDATPILERALAAIQGSVENLAFSRDRR